MLAIDRQGGGSGFNMALDLKRLDPEIPVQAMGVVGDDDLGRFLITNATRMASIAPRFALSRAARR